MEDYQSDGRFGLGVVVGPGWSISRVKLGCAIGLPGAACRLRFGMLRTGTIPKGERRRSLLSHEDGHAVGLHLVAVLRQKRELLPILGNVLR